MYPTGIQNSSLKPWNRVTSEILAKPIRFPALKNWKNGLKLFRLEGKGCGEWGALFELAYGSYTLSYSTRIQQEALQLGNAQSHLHFYQLESRIKQSFLKVRLSGHPVLV